jgi:2-succinyl-6-hydroxy-2,4-cyclohexadiene-1-carboxylate synthase
VLVHGFTQRAESWEPVVEHLGEGHEIILPDLPGHGDSPLPDGGLPEVALLLGDACGQAGYVGYSLGGRVCLHLALSRPALVSWLVLVSTTAGIDDNDAREARRESDEALAARLEEGGDESLPAFVDEWLAGPLFEGLGEQEAGRAARLSNSAAGLAASLRRNGTGTQLPLWELLGELAMPVLIVAGANDGRFVDNGQRLAAAIGANALFVLVPGAGHAVPFEQPAAFSRLVLDFSTNNAGAEA